MSIDEILAPPTEAQIRQSLARFSTNLTKHYGERLRGLYLYGSRARRDSRPDSDVDVAVVLADDQLDLWEEAKALSDLSYDELVDRGVNIESTPISEADWTNPSRCRSPSLLYAIKRDGRPIKFPDE